MIFPWLLILCSMMSVNQWNHVFNLGNTTIGWIVDALMILIVLSYIYAKRLYILKEYNYCILFLVWMIVNAVRGGLYMCESYWDYKNLISTVMALTMPLFAMYFGSPRNVRMSFMIWNKWIPRLFFFAFLWFIGKDAYHFLLTPFLLYGIFIAEMNTKWKVITAIILVLMLIDITSRAQFLKAIFTIFLAIAWILRKRIWKGLYTIGYVICYILPIALLILGFTGTFNIFEDASERNHGKYVGTEINANGEEVRSDASADTRTFIYIEVISSAIEHNYVIWGRTPARGNDSAAFGINAMETMKGFKHMERIQNEVCHPNIFTWLGLIGLFLHCMIYFKASWLAFRHSRSLHMRFIGMMIAFNWALGWIENSTGFNIMNLTIWLMIGMGLSRKFRKMNDREFRLWFSRLFPHNLLPELKK